MPGNPKMIADGDAMKNNSHPFDSNSNGPVVGFLYGIKYLVDSQTGIQEPVS